MSFFSDVRLFLKEARTQRRNVVLHCDNPTCCEKIESGNVAYDKDSGEIYHGERECELYGEMHRFRVSGRMTLQRKEYISIEEAKELFLKRKLNQSKKIEDVFSD